MKHQNNQKRNKMTTLTLEQKRRVELAIKETEKSLNKELKYSEDLQNKELIRFYNSHINKLKLMLN